MKKISKLTLLFIISFLTANQIDTIISNILNNKKKYSEEELYSYIKKNQNDSSTLILNGLIEIDGQKSSEFFHNYYSKNSNGQYAELAIFKLGDYYYSRGSYMQASKWHKKIIMDYPESKYLKSSMNYFLNSLAVSGRIDSAKYYSKFLKDKYPYLNFNSKFYSEGSSSLSKYYIEIGVYELYNKALSVKSALSEEGFFSIIDEIVINNNNLYKLKIGYYNDLQKAENIKKRIYSRFGFDNLKIITSN